MMVGLCDMNWQMFVVGTGEGEPKTKKNGGKLLRKPRSVEMLLLLLLLMMMMLMIVYSKTR
jgi:hypothetical protein